MISKKINISLSILFFASTIVFIILLFSSQSFLEWAFERHQNQLSWYIRPLFLIPFSYFAFKKNLLGISLTIFLLFTSMIWFGKPENVNQQIITFLEFEKNWLTSEWNFNKIFFASLVPISFFLLGFAFWKRSLLLGILILVIIAIVKILWSLVNAGNSAMSIIIPAITGLILCIAIIYFFWKKEHKDYS